MHLSDSRLCVGKGQTFFWGEERMQTSGAMVIRMDGVFDVPAAKRLARELAETDEHDEVRQVHGSDTTVMEAIYHVVEHFSMHTGQIQWIAKSQLGHL